MIVENGRFVQLKCDRRGCARIYRPRPAIKAVSTADIFPKAIKAGWLCTAAVPGPGNRWKWADLCPSHAKAVLS